MSGPAFQLEGYTIRRGAGTGETGNWDIYMRQHPASRAPPPDVAWSPGGAQGQASRLLGFLKEIEGKPALGPV